MKIFVCVEYQGKNQNPISVKSVKSVRKQIMFSQTSQTSQKKGAALVEQPLSNSTRAYQKIFGTSQVKAT